MESDGLRAYEFAFRATSIGRTPDEAFERLLEALKEDPREAINEEVSYAPYDYFYMEGAETGDN